MDVFYFIFLGLVQGLTEFLPVSSSGHLILARELFGLEGAFGLAEDAVLHLATACAVLIYFRSDIRKLLLGAVSFVRTGKKNTEISLILALFVGTVPAVIAGVFFEDLIENFFRGSAVVAVGLIFGSLIFLAAEYVGNRKDEKEEMTLRKGFVIGIFQALALLPGMSRSGMVISGGLMLGLSRFEAARFGFLLSFPVILGAGGLKFLELASQGALVSIGWPLLGGAVSAFISGMLAIHILLSFVRTNSLFPFAVYRLVLAAGILLLLW